GDKTINHASTSDEYIVAKSSHFADEDVMARFQVVASLNIRIDDGKGADHGVISQLDLFAFIVVPQTNNCVWLDNAIDPQQDVVIRPCILRRVQGSLPVNSIFSYERLIAGRSA